MGFGRGLPLWALMFMICRIEQEASAARNPETVTIIPPLATTPIMTSFNPTHNERVCSTWGNFYYKTFDGDIYHFPGGCNYVFASHCNAPYEDFNIQIRRTSGENANHEIETVTMQVVGINIEMNKDAISVDGERIQTPYSAPGCSIEKVKNYMVVSVKQCLQLMLNEDSLMVVVDPKYANQTCGLCGDFNGIQTYNEFYSNNAQITPLQFGNMQKMNGPTEDCEDPTSSSLISCANVSNICQEILMGPAFSGCNNMVEVNKYIETCEQDLCFCDQNTMFSCLCDTFAEYSRQCAHAGGHPQNWRTPDLCPKTCPSNMQYQECGSPCADTCTNSESSQLCEDHCLDGCVCPAGTVHDDINNSGCIPIQECSCIYNGKTYAPGTTYSDHCRSCSCSGGQWSCTEMPCPGICSVEGGSHISTYDEKRYDVHGDCTYVLSKVCDEETFTVLGELRKCGLTETETCLKMVALSINGGQSTIVVKPGGAVFVNWIYTQLPISTANVTIFRPSSFFIMMETNFGLQMEIQLTPIMQVFARLDPSFKGKTCGLCGNFDGRQIDDFKAISGVVEGTAPAFANTWKTQAICPNIKQSFENPCSLSIENEKYAHHWCGLLTDSEGPFAKCHPSLNPASYYENCLFDTCNCERSEDCMCAILSAYVRACAAKGIELSGWRTNVCSKYMTTCPKSLSYSYTISSCSPTCRSLSEPDVTCNIKFVPVDGCVCENGTYLREDGKCVPANSCPCYYRGTPVLPGEVLHEAGVVCTCAQGKLNCIGDENMKSVCTAPMVYFDCKNATTGSTGAECQKSCQTLDMHCYSTQCMSGCMCPAGLVSDGNGNCIAMEACPCIHNDATYNPGEKIKVDCNTCVCQNRMWKCTKNKCLGTCAVYGDGHYITFDDKRYNFNGKCEYTLVQDHCGQNSSTQGTFRVITENIPCGSTGTTCSKSIKIFLENYELILSEEQSKVVTRGDSDKLPYRIRYMGIYLVIETINGVILSWDKKTSIFIKISPDFKGQVCGLCGNYDGNGINDFRTRSQSVVGDVLEFGNSWKVSPTCPDAQCIKDPCSKNPYRKSWSQKQCSIITSKVFAACHSQVEPTKYYEACVIDACACDTGGDCECFCTAVAAYAQACSEFGVCISWRTPTICPMFCDYYNAEGECDWHYKPCGAPCMKTCRNPSGRCLHQLHGLEGCYPYCPADKPYFNEDEMKCVDQCGCYDAEDNYYPLGTHFDLRDTCQSCTCNSEGIECNFNSQACYCHYEGREYVYQEVIYNTTDGLGWCMTATCDVNGTIHRDAYKCAGLTTLPPFTFTTTPSTSGAESTTPGTTACVHKVCEWSEWYDISYPKPGEPNGDYETPNSIRSEGHNLCKFPDEVECRAEKFPNIKVEYLNQNIKCNKNSGLICHNKDQKPPICYNYEIKFLCCKYIPCEMTSPTSITTFQEETTPTITLSTSLGTETTPCEPECSWTIWFDVSHPSSHPEGGDNETIAAIQAAGGKVCAKPQDVQCRAEDYHDVNPSLLGQKIQCDRNVGLLCDRSAQTGKLQMCLNYQIRFYCCDNTHCQTGTTPGATTIAVTTRKPESTPGPYPGVTSTPPSSSVGSTLPPTLGTSTHGTTVVPTTAGKESATTLSTLPSTVKVTTPASGSTASVTPTTVSSTTATSLQSTPVSKPTALIPTLGTTSQGSTTSIITATTIPPAGSTSPSGIEASTTVCQPKCSWTIWFDVSHPSSHPEGGDNETIAAIQAAGGKVCAKPQDVQCRAEDYHDVNPSLLGQKIQCDRNVGLLCDRSAQTGKLQMCLNYQIRFYCCDNTHCQTGTTPGATTIAVTTRKPESTPGPFPGVTSTPPSSSVGSTLPPTLGTSTHGTTVVPTTAGKESATTLSTLPSTVKVTTPASGSTASVTPTTVSSTTATSLQSTPVSKPTALIPTLGTTSQGSTTSIITATTIPPAGSTSPGGIEASTTVCQPKCSWTIWFDVSHPSSHPEGGDNETIAAIQAAGGKVCAKPQDVQCRAEDYHDVNPSLLGQKIQCDRNVGLLCDRSAQTGKLQMCLNYQTRFYCCDNTHCQTGTTPGATTIAVTTRKPESTPGPFPGVTSTPPSSSVGSTLPPTLGTSTHGTTVVPTTAGKESATTLSTLPSTVKVTTPASGSTASVTPTTVSSTTATSLQSTPVSKPTALIPTLGTTSQGSTTSIITATTIPPAGSTSPGGIEASTTVCQPKCSWTIWFDVSHPSSHPKGGDNETIAAIQAAGGKVCAKPQDVQCRAEDYHNVNPSLLGQKIQCDRNVGLLCDRSAQTGKLQMCLNYQIRFYCCDNTHCQTGTTPGATTIAVTTRKPESTPGPFPGVTSTPPSSSVGSTLPPTLGTSTHGTTVVPTTAGKESATTLSTLPSTVKVTTPASGSTASVTPTTVSSTTATSLQSTPVSKPTALIPTLGTTSQGSTTSIITATTIPPAGSTSPSGIEASTTVCQPKCSWTIWFDVSHPSSHPEGGDNETITAIQAAGGKVCAKPQDVQCRAEDYHDVNPSLLGQKIQCDRNVGLLCDRSAQTGKLQMCLNYQIRFYCCDNTHCQTGTTPGATTIAVTTRKPESTPGPFPGVTSPPPSSSVGSTLPPTLGTSTHGTTVVPTTAGKESATTLSTLPSTVKVTTPASGSTASVTPTTVSSTTATSLQSTPVSKPTALIPTLGTTSQGSTTSIITATTIPPAGSTSPSGIEASTTVCQPKCSWTIWFDVSHPSSHPEGGDNETITAIQAAGGKVCAKPQDVQCRAEDYHDVNPSLLGQKIQCDRNVGLLCDRSAQTGKLQMCLNYQIRFYCCDNTHCQTGTTPGATTIAVTTRKPESTPGPFPGVTSTPPSSSVGSTLPPTLGTSTHGTTVVPTTAGKESATTLSTLPSTVKVTTPASGSTASVTPTTVSSTTATSLQSTPVSKPTALIPTLGTTSQGSTTSIITATTIPPAGSTSPSGIEASTTVCQPKCSWTIWFDVSHPSSHPEGGDNETIAAIQAAGGKVCAKPQDVQCRAEDYHDVNPSLLGQKIQCDRNVGLLCDRSAQTGKLQMCLNYQTRFYCCDNTHCQTGTTPGATTIAVTTRKPESTPGPFPGVTSTPPSSSVGSTLPPTLGTSTHGTTVVPTTAGKESATTLSTLPSTVKVTTPASGSTASVTPTTVSSTTATSLQSTPVSKPTALIPTLGTTSQGSTTSIITATTIPPAGSTSPSGIEASTTVCQPKCSWTIWFDVSHPSSHPEGGDNETIAAIQAAGGKVCAKPQDVQCRAEDYHDVNPSLLGQKIQCDRNVGLLCDRSAQTGKLQMCLNYQIRFYCCDNTHCQTGTTPGATTIAVTTRKPESTPGPFPGVTSTPPSSSVGSTLPPTLGTSTHGTTVVPTTAGKESATTLSTLPSTVKVTTPASGSTASVTPTTVSSTTATSLQSTPVSKPTALIPTLGTTSQGSTTSIITATTIPPAGSTSPSGIEASTTVCQPKCSWTIWFDVSHPSSHPEGGDNETIAAIQAAGGKVCAKPQDVQCRAEDYHDVNPSLLGQKIQCDRNVGLLCDRSAQTGKLQMCLNYQIRFYCCDNTHCQTGTTPGATTIAVTTRKPESTPGPFPGVTSTPPSSSVGSTLPPTLGTSTHGTTVVPTTAGKESATTLSTLPSTVKVTTPASGSTASVTPTTVSSTTATSLQSTPVSKPTALIPTLGTTSQGSTTSIITATTIPPAGSTSPGGIEASTTVCQPKCSWTIWFDVSHPSSHPEGGDNETIAAIQAAGGKVCAKPQDVQCRAEDYHDVNPSLLGQKIQCDRNVGLLCDRSAQTGKLQMCLNYQIRFYCCDNTHCQTGTTPGATTIAVTTRKPESTPGPFPGVTSTPPSSSVGSTLPPTLGTSTHGTTVVPTTAGKESATTLSTLPSTVKVTTPASGSTASVTPTTVSSTTATSLQSTPVSKPTALIPTLGTTSQGSTTSIITATTIPPAGSTSPSGIEASTTVCQPKCSWTIWFDVSHPSSHPEGGDNETIAAIQAAGGKVCAKPQDVQCQAEDYHDVNPSLLGQKIQCDRNVGLLCDRSAQTGKLQMCLNYQIRFYCCDNTHCQTGTTPGATTIAVTTRKPESTPGPFPGVTSTPPSSSVGSTLPPTLGTSTHGTTVVPTTAGKESATTLSTLPSTVKVTTPASGSTASVTPTTVSSTTATSLQSTPVSKPTALIPTLGTTSQGSTTSIITATTIPPAGSTSPGGIEASTTVCQPKCSWTIWFDVSHPSSHPEGGDNETIAAIQAAGGKVCAKPQDVQCRAEDYHDVNPSLLGQKIQCDRNVGLLCDRSAQTGKLQMCLNYQIRFYCCDNTHCQTGTTPGATTIAVTTRKPESTPGPFPGVTSTPPSSSVGSTLPPTLGTSTHGTTVVPTSTASTMKTATTSSTGYISVTSSGITPCFCHVSGNTSALFSPGEVIYNKTDSSGCIFYAICDQNCEVKRSQGPCPSTTPPRPSTPSITTVQTSSLSSAPTPTILIPSTIEHTSSAPSTAPVLIPTTPVQDCPDADPPRKTNETWMLNNCSMATCEGNNRIVVVLPPPVDKITCANRLPPVKINHDDGCSYHYECTCICSGWDNSHYETFDGTNYTFYDNCTYILVQEILKKHGNFSVLVDNYFCDPVNNESCSRSIIVNYNHMEVILSSQIHNGMRTNKVIFNKEIVRTGFSKDGIIVAHSGTSMSVEILDIHAFINFNGFTFSIQVPFDLFAFNTEGQCGTCSNDRSDDCRLPSGHKASSCSEMASHWNVDDNCEEVIPTPQPTGVTPTPEIPCTTPSPLCELIVSDIFADCHKVLPPQAFYDHCLSEVCQNASDTLTCYTVEMYASLCIDKGFCSDWRSNTKGKCPYHCPEGKVYEACGPVHPATCDNGKTNEITEHVAEGCFCPADQILVNSYTDTCVPDCNFCIGPDGFPKMPGTTWRSNCQECTCDQLSVTVQCKAQPCPTPATLACKKEGFMPVSVLTPEDPCCPEMQCICNTSACSNQKKSCEPGYQLVSILFEGDCCVSFLCEPIPDICVVNGTVYTPGASIPSDSCKTCVCGHETDPGSKTNLVKCEPIPCDTACSVGYEYQVKAGECCGTCVQVTCTININGTIEVLKPGDIWQPEGNNCSHYECEKEEDKLILVNTRRTCPIFDPEECGPNETELTPDGCCEICKPQTNCKVRTNQILIHQNDCESSEMVELTYCEGACPSSSMYSTEARAMQHKCTCCQELRSHKKAVSLTCQDGRTINYDYIYVDECQCMTACIPEATAP
ncbi:mucin-5AC-like [Paroedura picta]|uniref:mucin-5AC-like n=1 Tax=Paroedura picta TaxID=143630 RepID=UPI0040569409